MKRRIILFIRTLFLLSLIQCGGADIMTVKDPVTPEGYFFSGPLPEKTAYLTFDDGPAAWTERFLDVLQKEKVKATFFVSAYWNIREHKGNLKFMKYRRALIRMIKEGHIIGNHTADHKTLTRLSDNEIREQFSKNQLLLNDAMGEKAPVMTILRPPMGLPWYSKSPDGNKTRIEKQLRETGLIVLWTGKFDSSDSWEWVKGEWHRPCDRIDESASEFIRKTQRIYRRIVSGADGRGIIILMHDTHNTTLKILPAVIKGLKNRGYRFDTLEGYFIWRYGKKSSELTGKNNS